MNLRLAYTGQTEQTLKKGSRGEEVYKTITRRPSMLFSYYYIKKPGLRFDASNYMISEWVLDSGAFSAYTTGTEICVEEYTDYCLTLLEQSDFPPCEIFALDVIGDWRASANNTDYMWERGVEAIPCFHYKSPWEELKRLAATYDKIALGGVAARSQKSKEAFIKQSFARVWPKKIHGFGMISKSILSSVPFHSVDATTWEIQPAGYGIWNSFGKDRRLNIRGKGTYDLRAELEWYLRLEDWARLRWKREMELLESIGTNI